MQQHMGTQAAGPQAMARNGLADAEAAPKPVSGGEDGFQALTVPCLAPTSCDCAHQSPCWLRTALPGLADHRL